MTVAKRLTVASVLVALGVVPSVAHAQDGKTAEALFKEGRALLDQRKYDEACSKLAESQKLEPGAGTLLALALCHEGQGKTATARKDLEDAAKLGRKNGRSDLAKAAEKRAAAMEPHLSKLVVRLPEGAADYDLRLDGEPVAREALGAPIAVDPGEHRADVGAKGKAPRAYVFRAAGTGTVEIVIDKLEDAKPALAAARLDKGERPASKASPALAPIDVEPPYGEADRSTGNAQRAIGLTVIGLGVAGLGVGGYFGARAVSQHNEGRTCTPSPCTDAQDANERAKASTTAAVVSGTAGFLAIGAGTILFFTAPKASSQAVAAPRASARVVPQAGPTQVGVGLVGTF